MTGLHLVAYFGLEAIFQPLLATAQFHVDSKDNGGRRPLSWAAEKGHEGIVKLLLATEEVNIDSKDEYGRTPLSRAVKKGYEAVVKLLLEKSAKLEIQDKDSRTPLA